MDESRDVQGDYGCDNISDFISGENVIHIHCLFCIHLFVLGQKVCENYIIMYFLYKFIHERDFLQIIEIALSVILMTSSQL